MPPTDFIKKNLKEPVNSFLTAHKYFVFFLVFFLIFDFLKFYFLIL